MKKMFLLATVAMGLASCSNSVDEVAQETQYGTIVLNMGLDDAVALTRGVQTVDGEDKANWEVQIEQDETVKVAWKAFSDYDTDDWTKPYGTYTVKVRNFSDNAFETTSMGQAVYTGEANVTVSGETNSVTVACGTQKTSQVMVTFLNSFKNTFNAYALTVTDANVAGRNFSTSVDINPIAYFLPDGNTMAGATYKLVGTLNGQSGQKVLANLETAKRLNPADLLDIQVSAKTEGGKIVLTVTYDDTTTPVTEEVVIDPTVWNSMPNP